MKLKIASLALLGLCPAWAVVDQKIDVLTQQKNWTAFQVKGEKGFCYVAGTPNNKARKGVRLLVTIKRIPERGEINYVAGYSLKDEAEGALKIGNHSYHMICKEDSAWMKDAAQDPVIIETLQKEKECVITAQDPKGHKFHDTFELAGFSKSYEAAYKACFDGDDLKPQEEPKPEKTSKKPKKKK